MDYRQIIESKYNRQNWQQLLHDIFGQNATFFTIPQPIQVDASIAQQALYIGNITLKDGNTLAVYEVELADRVQIERNRTGIRNLLCSSWKGIFTGALMFCFRQNESALRFSYVSETYAFADDGSLKKESTDTKRFTYLLGEGHRSRTAIAQFEALSKSGLTLKDLTKAFSVEALSDLFFKEYKKQYEDIIEYVTGRRMVKVGNKWEERTTCPPNDAIMQQFSGFPDAEKAVRDYVKKLMGRLVFIQFLQKKGWMGCPAGADWNSGDKEFVQNLFAHSVHKDDFVDDVLEPLFIDLNTRRTNDLVSSIHVGRNIRVPYLNGGLFEKDAYDKTKFPLPARFMQSMLDFFASYNFTIDENDPDDAEIGVDPEMLGRIFENLLEDNKDKGAFYTPKEIVQYMCRESLIAYLQTNETDDAVKESIRQFVTTHKANTLYDNLLPSIDQKLKDVKICDPAIGSGAFPMGLLRELYACRKAIEGIDDDKAVSIKSHIIQNNIYGVDIEKGAVDIARLRFWLALIVDEKTPHALPNMDFKIMQGNSLLEQYEGVDLSGLSLNEQAQKKAKANKQQTWQQTMVFDEQDALDNIQNAIHKYFETQDHTKKEELRGIVDENVRNYIKNIKGCTPAIEQKLANLPIPNNQFFLWHIYFKEVFDKGGFDIVIGNPPYVDYRKIDLLTKRGLPAFETYRVEATGSLYVYFIEKGITLLKTNGMLIFINPYQYLSANSGKGLRTYIINNAHRINSIIDISNIKVFDSASTYTCINSFSKESGLHDIKVYKPLTLNKLQENVAMVKQSSIKKPSYEIYLSTNSVISKLDTIKTTLKDVCSIFCGLSATGFRKFVSDVPLTQRHAIFVEAKQIQKYTISPNKYIDTNIYSKSVLQKFQNECLLMARMTSHMRVGKSSSGYTAGKVNVLHQFKCPEYFLLGLLNSKLLDYYYCQKCEVLHLNGGALPFDTESVKRIPIPLEALDVQNQIVAIVNRILAAKQQNPQADTSQEEAMIDILVYLLYNLTYDEVKVVDNAFAVPEDVYNQWLSNYQAASTLPTEEEICKQNIQKLQDAGIIVDDLLSDLQETLEKKLEEELGKAPSGQATPVAVKSSATKSAANVKKNAHNDFPVTNQSSAQLTEEELDLLLRIDNATTYSFTEYDCLGDLHERIEVILKDKGPERTASVTMTGMEIRKRLQDIEREREMVEKEREEQRRNYDQIQHEIYQKLNNENLTDAQREKIREILWKLESACFPSITWQKSNALIEEAKNLNPYRDLSDTQTAQIEYSYTILGQYIRPASTDANPQVILYLESIRKCTNKPDENKYHIAQIYLHEMFHAYFDANPYGTDYYIAKVEEPITELGALAFIDSFAKSYKDKDFIELARNNVELKKYNPAISFYSFGLYLFKARNGKTFVQNWYDKRSSIDASSKQVQDYEDLFRIGYPGNEKTALSKLKSIFQ